MADSCHGERKASFSAWLNRGCRTTQSDLSSFHCETIVFSHTRAYGWVQTEAAQRTREGFGRLRIR